MVRTLDSRIVVLFSGCVVRDGEEDSKARDTVTGCREGCDEACCKETSSANGRRDSWELASCVLASATGLTVIGSKKNQGEETLQHLQALPDGQLAVMPFPGGELAIVGSKKGLRWLDFASVADRSIYRAVATKDEDLSPPMLEAKQQLEEYLAGKRQTFDVKLDRKPGTEFQMRVWNALCEIPYGQTMSYGEVAAHLGKPTAYRAVANACKSNPIGLIVPCHRVVGKNRDLVGFGGGVCLKQWFLQHEGWKQ